MANEIPVYLFAILSVRRLVTWFDQNFYMIASTIYIWDYILTFNMEVDLVWKSRWTLMKALYLFQRYLPFIEAAITLYHQTGGSGLTKTVCRHLSFSSGVMAGLGFVASEVILTLRTWAVWNRNRRLSFILPIFFTLVEGSSFVIVCIFLKSVKYSDPPYRGFKGCLATSACKYDLVFLWALTIFWDSLMLILMLVPGARAFRAGGNSALVKTVYRDGVIYYLYLFVISFINTIVLAILPNQQFLVMILRMLRSILTSRVLLNIRAQRGEEPVHSDGLTELNTDHLYAEDTRPGRLQNFRPQIGRLSSSLFRM